MAAVKHVVTFKARGRVAACTCTWRASVSDDLSTTARRRVIDAAEDHAFDNAGTVELAGLDGAA